MADRFDFVSATDKPALLALTKPEWITIVQTALSELGYKVQKIGTHLEFPNRFAQVPYQIVVIEDQFADTPPTENLTLQTVQALPMNQRRHSTIILIGESYETLNALQAFQMSVHAVINFSEMALFRQLVKKVISENELFFTNYREISQRVSQGK
ncbi:MAG: hypothetical protein ABIQ35_00545 [Verrucomicrobiota bacterium]